MCFHMLFVTDMNTHFSELTVLKNSLTEYGFQHHTLKKRCVCGGGRLGGEGENNCNYTRLKASNLLQNF